MTDVVAKQKPQTNAHSRNQETRDPLFNLPPIDRLNEWEQYWRTEMGGWFPGERAVLRGKNIFTDLKNQPWMAVHAFAITGWLPTPNQCKIFEAIWSLSTSYPDPRIWNNRIATLAATARSTYTLGMCGAFSVSEAIVYGLRPVIAICDMLVQAKQHLDNNASLPEFIQQRLEQKTTGKPGIGKNRALAKLPGFGRPITKGDERIQPMYELAVELGFENGDYLQLIHQIEHTLQSMGYDWRMNSAAQVCAILLDQGMTPRQAYQFLAPSFCAGVAACFVDAENHPEGSFFPMRCERIQYRGPALRQWNQ